jgi:hypothetical protein
VAVQRGVVALQGVRHRTRCAARKDHDPKAALPQKIRCSSGSSV